MRTVCIALGLVLLTSVSLFAGDKVIARVGSEPITQAEITNALAQNPDITRQQAFESLVERLLVLSWATDNGMTVQDEEIDALERSLMENNNLTAQQLEQAITDRGETPETFRDNLREQILVNRAVGVALRDQVTISEEEIEKIYQERFPARENFKLNHILIKAGDGATETEIDNARKTAEEVHSLLAGGASFDDMVRQHSQDSSTKDSGGSLGTFKTGELIPELEDAVRPLAVGEFSRPVKTAAGFHIVLLKSRDTEDPPPLNTVRDKIRNFLMAGKEGNARVKWMEELREKYFIEIFD